MFAPVAELGLVVIWDDRRRPARRAAGAIPARQGGSGARAHRSQAAALLGGFARTTEVTQLVDSGWAAALTGDRATVRRCAPRITAAGDDAELARDEAARSARMPGLALRTAREALASGPVLFQVPRRGYVVSVACERCGARARCPACAGPLALPGAGAAARMRLVRQDGASALCPVRAARPARAGHRRRRTAEELGRAFPAASVRTSGGAEVIAEVGGGAGGHRGDARCRAACLRGMRGRGAARWLRPCSAGPACARPRRRCAAGSTPLRWCGQPDPGPTAARSWSSPSPLSLRSRGTCVRRIRDTGRARAGGAA